MKHDVPRPAGWKKSLVLSGVLTVPAIWAVIMSPSPEAMHVLLHVLGILSGAVLVFAAVMGHLLWRLQQSDPVSAWITAVTLVVAAQVTGLALTPVAAAEVGGQGWLAVVDIAATAAMLGAGWVLVRHPQRALIVIRGSGLLAVAVVASTLGIPLVGLAAMPAAVVAALAWVLLLGQLALAAAILRSGFPRWATAWLALALVVVVATRMSQAGDLSVDSVHLVLVTLVAVAAAAWTNSVFVLLRSGVEHARRRALTLETSMLTREATRDDRERLHELRSVVAGLVGISGLLDDPDLCEDEHHRLEHLVHDELSRIERLLTDQPIDLLDVDLDAELDRVVGLHRVRGRTVEWEPSGTSVRCQPDAIAEAVNILLDNAACHSGTLQSRIDISAVGPHREMVRITVSDQGRGIPVGDRQRIFESGVRREDSRGEGIGLALARRLMVEQGGSLTLEGDGRPGASFVIMLPAGARKGEGRVPAQRTRQ